MGHSPFGLADEYCCDGGYFSTAINPVIPYNVDNYSPLYPNLFSVRQECFASAEIRPYDVIDCRTLTSSDDGEVWWIGEPDFRTGIPALNQVRDLMQQTGNIDEGLVDDDGNTVFTDRYKLGDSEIYRMNWHVWRQCLFEKVC
jgi:hypothetical protein